MTRMKVLISGGTGFLGQAFAKSLLKKGHSVKILGRSSQKIKSIFLNDPVEAVQGDVTVPETLFKATEGIDVVIQCAQFPNYPVENKRKGWTFWKVDAIGTENLAKAAQANKIKHFIYLSGAGTDNKKTEPWYRAKWYAEQSIHGCGLPATILRPSWVYGPGDKTLNRILSQIKYLPIIPLIDSGRNHVQPIFVDDLAELVTLCVSTAGTQDRIFDVGGPQELTFKTMMKIVLKIRKKRALLLPIPKNIAKIGAFFLPWLPPIDFITMDARLDMAPLKKAFPQLSFKTVEEALFF